MPDWTNFERLIAPDESVDPEGFKKVDKQLNDDLQYLVTKYNLSSLVVGAAYLSNPHEAVDADPNTHNCTFVYKVLVNEDLLDTSKKKINDLKVDELTAKEQAQTYVCIKHTAALYNLLYSLMSHEEEELKNLATRLSEVLGYSKSRLIAISPNVKYLVVCEHARYEVIYDDDFMFTVTLYGEQPEKFLVFMGNVQGDGNIFHAFEMPVFSTGDRLLFGRRDVKSAGKAIPQIITSAVLDVMPINEVN